MLAGNAMACDHRNFEPASLRTSAEGEEREFVYRDALEGYFGVEEDVWESLVNGHSITPAELKNIIHSERQQIAGVIRLDLAEHILDRQIRVVLSHMLSILP